MISNITSCDCPNLASEFFFFLQQKSNLARSRICPKKSYIVEQCLLLGFQNSFCIAALQHCHTEGLLWWKMYIKIWTSYNKRTRKHQNYRLLVCHVKQWQVTRKFRYNWPSWEVASVAESVGWEVRHAFSSSKALTAPSYRHQQHEIDEIDKKLENIMYL